MLKREFFLRACKAEAYRHKQWVLAAFSQTRSKGNQGEFYPYQIREGELYYYFVDPENKDEDMTILEDCPVGKPPFSFLEPVELSVGDVPNLRETVKTTYGNTLFNFNVLVYAFNDKIDFVTGRVSLKKIEREIKRRLTTDGAEPPVGVEDPIFVSEYLRYVNASLSLVGYTQLCVPSATRKTMTRDPRIPELKERLLEKYKDSLNDPATIAKIDAELIAMDKEWMKGDAGEGFYIKEKSYNIVRKRAHLMHGAESGFRDGTDVDLVKNSLGEGWDIDKLPSMVNSLREGTYSRGALTALGGESVKTLTRIFQNTRIMEEDCGSRLGTRHEITQHNHVNYIGFNRIVPSGIEEITEKNSERFIGKTLVVRSPMFCKTPKTGFCEKCMGRQNSQNPNALGSLVSSVGSQFMSILMGAMHGKALKTAEFDPTTAIT